MIQLRIRSLAGQRVRLALALAAWVGLAPVAAQAQAWVYGSPPVVVMPAPAVVVPAPGYNPCRDGSINWGRPVNCEELMRRAQPPVILQGADPAYDPCQDGRIHWGRPVDCAALFRGRRVLPPVIRYQE